MGDSPTRSSAADRLAAESAALLAEEIRRRLATESMAADRTHSSAASPASWQNTVSDKARSALGAIAFLTIGGRLDSSPSSDGRLGKQVVGKDAAWSECRSSIEGLLADIRNSKRSLLN